MSFPGANGQRQIRSRCIPVARHTHAALPRILSSSYTAFLPPIALLTRIPGQEIRGPVDGAFARIRNKENIMPSPSLQSVARILHEVREAREIVVFSGAGLSADSGIPPFCEAAHAAREKVHVGSASPKEGFLRKALVVW